MFYDLVHCCISMSWTWVKLTDKNTLLWKEWPLEGGAQLFPVWLVLPTRPIPRPFLHNRLMITLKMYLKMGSVVSYFYLFFYLLLLSFVYFCYVILLYCMPFLHLLAVFIGESNECVCVCVYGCMCKGSARPARHPGASKYPPEEFCSAQLDGGGHGGHSRHVRLGLL